MKCIFSIVVFFVGYIAMSSCRQDQKKQGLEHVTISPDDEFILFSYYVDGVSSIYSMDISNNKTKKLFSSGKSISYVNPKYSPNGKMIAFIGYSEGKNSISSNIFIANSDGKELKQITTSNQIITEAIISYDNKSIYFIGASEYNKYSSIGIKTAHNFDVYRIDLDSGIELKMTNFSAYRLSNISEMEQGKYILMVLAQGINSGMNAFPIQCPDSVITLTPSNNPREGLYAGYGRPVYSDKYKMYAFTAPYELYIMNSNDKIAKNIYRSSEQIMQILFLNKQRKVLFTLQGENNIKSIRLDGSDLTHVPINIR